MRALVVSFALIATILIAPAGAGSNSDSGSDSGSSGSDSDSSSTVTTPGVITTTTAAHTTTAVVPTAPPGRSYQFVASGQCSDTAGCSPITTAAECLAASQALFQGARSVRTQNNTIEAPYCFSFSYQYTSNLLSFNNNTGSTADCSSWGNKCICSCSATTTTTTTPSTTTTLSTTSTTTTLSTTTTTTTTNAVSPLPSGSSDDSVSSADEDDSTADTPPDAPTITLTRESTAGSSDSVPAPPAGDAAAENESGAAQVTGKVCALVSNVVVGIILFFL